MYIIACAPLNHQNPPPPPHLSNPTTPIQNPQKKKTNKTNLSV